MISLTKSEILTCLEKVSRQIESMCVHQTTPINQFLSDLTMTDLRVYMFISKLRYLSYYEDAFINSIDNDDINLSDLRDKIFVDENTKNRFSNKQIIKFIRNAFSHNDATKELYHISVNGRYLEIHLKNVNPCEFHIKMTYSDLEELVNRLKPLNFYLSVFKNDKFRRYYLKNKLNISDDLMILDILDNRIKKHGFISKNDYSECVIEYYSIAEGLYEVKEYDIMPEQLQKLKELDNIVVDSINKLSKNGNNENKAKLVETFREHQLSKIIPLQEEKLNLKEDNMLFIKLMCEFPNCSYKELESEFIKTGYNLFNDIPLNEVQKAIESNIGRNPARLFLFNGGDLENDTYMEYISFYIMNMCCDSTIKIGSEVYLTEHIRNAFAHGRWFIDNYNNFVLCDTKNGKHNDYNFYWKEKIKLIDLLEMIFRKNTSIKNKTELQNLPVPLLRKK